MSLSQAQVITASSYLDEINNTVFLSWCKCYLAVVMCTRYFYYCYNYHHFYFLGRLPKVDLIILEGENVRPYIHPSVHKKFLRFE